MGLVSLLWYCWSTGCDRCIGRRKRLLSVDGVVERLASHGLTPVVLKYQMSVDQCVEQLALVQVALEVKVVE